MKKYLPCLLLLVLCTAMPQGAFLSHGAGASCGIGTRWFDPLIYHFSHANPWHFLINALYLAQFAPRWSTVGVGYLIASACAEMPFTGLSAPTCGISGMCFAMQARHDVAWRVLNWRLIAINFGMAFFPMFNWKLHLAAYATSFAVWKAIYKTRQYRKTR